MPAAEQEQARTLAAQASELFAKNDLGPIAKAVPKIALVQAFDKARQGERLGALLLADAVHLSLIHISEPTRPY